MLSRATLEFSFTSPNNISEIFQLGGEQIQKLFDKFSRHFSQFLTTLIFLILVPCHQKLDLWDRSHVIENYTYGTGPIGLILKCMGPLLYLIRQ